MRCVQQSAHAKPKTTVTGRHHRHRVAATKCTGVYRAQPILQAGIQQPPQQPSLPLLLPLASRQACNSSQQPLHPTPPHSYSAERRAARRRAARGVRVRLQRR